MWRINISHLFAVTGNCLFYSLSTKSRIMNSCGISCVTVRNRDSNWSPFSFGLNSPGSSPCRKPPQMHRAFPPPPAPGVPRRGEVGCDFQHFGHWQTFWDGLPPLLTPPRSPKSVTVVLATLPLGFPACAVKS